MTQRADRAMAYVSVLVVAMALYAATTAFARSQLGLDDFASLAYGMVMYSWGIVIVGSLTYLTKDWD